MGDELLLLSKPETARLERLLSDMWHKDAAWLRGVLKDRGVLP